LLVGTRRSTRTRTRGQVHPLYLLTLLYTLRALLPFPLESWSLQDRSPLQVCYHLSHKSPLIQLLFLVRVRPPSTWEAARLPDLVYDTTIRGDAALAMPERSSTTYSSVREVVQIIDDRILTFDPAEPDQAKAFVERGFLPPGTKRYKDRRFMFDRVFRPDASQREVYDATARPLLQRLLDGFNTTVFAYGVS
jgi:Kinesin motor domain